MKPDRMKLFLLFISVIVVTSCSIEKRLYQPGWHVAFKRKICSSKIAAEKVTLPYLNSESIHDSVFIAEVNTVPVIGAKQTTTEPVFSFENEDVSAPNKFTKTKAKIHNITLTKIPLANLFESIKRQESKNYKELGFLDTITLVVVLICTIVIAAGICAIIFGQHWAWLVLGIVLIILALLALIGLIGSNN